MESFRNSIEISPLLMIWRMITLLGLAEPVPVLVESVLYELSMLNSTLDVDEVLATEGARPTPLFVPRGLMNTSCAMLARVWSPTMTGKYDWPPRLSSSCMKAVPSSWLPFSLKSPPKPPEPQFALDM